MKHCSLFRVLIVVVLAFPLSARADSELCACTARWDPVCGVDGETYSNSGCASCAGVEVQCEGECPCPCVCTEEYGPVCGVNGMTYDNKCFAECAGVEYKCNDECPCLCDCTFDASPVCGIDGETYGSRCRADCSGVHVACEGECPCPCEVMRTCVQSPCLGQTCPAYPNATCGSDPCDGCKAVFTWKGEVVDCEEPPLPSVLPPVGCLPEDAICVALPEEFVKPSTESVDCCAGYVCCADCAEGDGLTVSSTIGTCKSHCPPCD